MSQEHVTWFRLYAEAVDDEKLRLLAYEDRWHFVAILCCQAQGLLNPDDPLMWRKVAVKLGLQTRELEEVARRLAEVGLIDGETLHALAWEKRQYKTDISTDRVRAYRERKRSETLLKRSETVSETPPETETETEEDTHPTDESAKTRGVSARSSCPYNEILSLWREILPELPAPHSPEHWTAARKAQIRARWNDQLPDLSAWRECFELVRRSPFLMGQTARPFRCRLFWLTKPENLLKLYEGNYDG